MHRTRSFRRKQLIKKKHRFEKIAVQEMFVLDRLQGEINPDKIRRWAAHVAAAPKKPCQCCCNPRHSVLYKKHEKLTMQERRDQITRKETEE